MKINLRETNEIERDIIGLMLGYIGVILISIWGFWSANKFGIPFIIK